MMRSSWMALFALGVMLATPHALAEAPLPQGFTRATPSRSLPDFRIIDSKGQKRGPGDLTGRVVVLNLWATWCAPCVHEMPSLERLQAELGGEKLLVVAVSLDREGRRVVERFRTQTGLKSLEVYYDPRGRMAEVLGAEQLPFTLIIGPQGEEVARVTGALDWSSLGVLAYLRDLMGTSSPTAPR